MIHQEHEFRGVDGRELRLAVWRAGPLADSARHTANGDETAGGTALHADRDAVLPVLLMLDGQWLHDTIVDALQGAASRPMLVASLGFTTGERAVIAPWRARDYTPRAPGEQQCDPRFPAWPCGGADTLLDLLRNEVLPLLEQQYAASSVHRELFGHSYAGLFASYTWLQAPELFSQIHAASPSFWWYWPHVLELIEEVRDSASFGSHHARPQLNLMVGDEERWRPMPAEPGQPRPEGIPTVPFAEQFLAAIQQTFPGIDTRLDILPGLAHGPMLFGSAQRCLKRFMES